MKTKSLNVGSKGGFISSYGVVPLDLASEKQCTSAAFFRGEKFGSLGKKIYRRCPLLRVFLGEELGRWGKACSSRASFTAFCFCEVVFEARSSLARRQVINQEG
jgi:hypothetical protein